MSWLDNIKQFGWKKVVLVVVAGSVGLFAVAAAAHSIVTLTKPKTTTISFNTPSPTPTIECPDRVEYDSTTGLPIWVRGETKKSISGEEDTWISVNCTNSSPSAQTASTSPTTNKSTTKTSPTATSSSKSTATPTTSTSTSSTATPTPSTNASATSTPTPTPTPTPKPASPPVLKNLGVAFADYDSQTGRAGAFDFLKLQSKPFVDFGDNGTEPTFTYRIAEDAEVIAVADGYVYKVEYQSTYSDYSILASTEKDDLTWSIDYDHVISPTVSVGDKITAGQKLGIAGTHSDIGIGRLEIQIFGGDGTTKSYCPFTYFDSSLIASYKAKLQKLMDDYEAYMYNTNIYNPDNYTTSGHLGCLAKTVAG